MLVAARQDAPVPVSGGGEELVRVRVHTVHAHAGGDAEPYFQQVVVAWEHAEAGDLWCASGLVGDTGDAPRVAEDEGEEFLLTARLTEFLDVLDAGPPFAHRPQDGGRSVPPIPDHVFAAEFRLDVGAFLPDVGDGRPVGDGDLDTPDGFIAAFLRAGVDGDGAASGGERVDERPVGDGADEGALLEERPVDLVE